MKNKGLRALRDIELVIENATQSFDWCKITIKKDTIIKSDYTYCENVPGCIYDKFYCVELVASEYREDEVIIEILRESDDDINEVNELRKECAFLDINAYDVEEVK